MSIKTLFDPGKDIYRPIEKVITYNASQASRLKAEISEYEVTDSIEEQFERLLTKMQTAMEGGGGYEVGVWVSGFYGSGKSSFTKYLGLALDQSVTIDGVPFLKHLQDRLSRPQTKALLATVASKFPAAVVLLDLASEMLAGATMEEVSTVLYFKVLQWAGYSRNLKVAALERRLKLDGRYDEFTARIQAELGTPWREVQNDPLVIDSLIPEIAHAMYPKLFKSPTAFSTETVDFVQFENERVKEMIDIVRETSGKDFMIFIIDEVGQYVGSRQNLIQNLDGLAKNLKTIGNGKVWIVGTAQQTLTEDDPRAALNSPELYKLSARFPIQIDLESSDIREICYRRLLGKSPAGAKTLGALFDTYGQALRHNTKLQDAKFYDSDFDKKAFVNLYPFLPAHFDILLHLLGALAKSTGGIGLRSAIKVIQEILVEGQDGQPPVADRPVGWLATTVTLYDSLEKDIRRAFPSIHKAVGKVLIRFPGSPVHQEVAKSVAVLQILGNMPLTPQNVASLMHPSVEAQSRRDQVDSAIEELTNDPIVPFGEKDGGLGFFSEKINDIDRERGEIPLRTVETRRIRSEALRDVFSPLPSARLHGNFAVSTGLKMMSGSQVSSLAGEREPIQTVVHSVEPPDYETARAGLVDESRQRSSECTIFLLGRNTPEIDERVGEIYRCREIVQRYRNDPDQEVKDYCVDQSDRAGKLAEELGRVLKRCLAQGSFVFRGQTTAVDSVDTDVVEAAKKHLAVVAEQVFDRYSEAPIRAETALAERFLRMPHLRAVTAEIDPLGLVQVIAGTPQIKPNHKALVSIRDYIDRTGTVEGKRAIDHFGGPPFGWSQDTLRYLIAACLVGGEIKLKVSGREITVNGQQAIDALRTNNAFKNVGISLRAERIPPEVLARAAERLTELTGDQVLPLEPEISKAATKYFPKCQLRFGPLAEKLDGLGVAGGDDVRATTQEIADVLLTDGSDAPQRLGAEESPLHNGIKWAEQVDTALKGGLEETIRGLQRHRQRIEALPNSGVPGRLRQDLGESLAQIAERLGDKSFCEHAPDLSTALTAMTVRVGTAAGEMAEAQKTTIKGAQQELQRLPEWAQLVQEEQASVLGQLEALQIDASRDLAGLERLLTQEFVIHSTMQELRKRILDMGAARAREKEKERRDKGREENVFLKTVALPSRVSSVQMLNELLRMLENLRAEALKHEKIDIQLELQDGSE